MKPETRLSQASIVIAILALVGMFIVPEVRQFLGLESDTPKTQLPADTPIPTPTPTNTPMPPTPTNTPMPPTPTNAPTIGSTMTREADGMVMVYVPGSTFQMGSDDRYDNEQPVHTVTLDSFWIDRTEVSNAQYKQCVDAGACQSPTTCDWGTPTYEYASKAHHPVVCVDWFWAQAYCEWAGARLPTEAEWEYAARGPDGYTYPWGNTFDGARLNFCDTNCNHYSRNTDYDDGYEWEAPVESFESGASWCGALNMAGNVWEWVSDWYQSDYYDASPSSNPSGPETGDYKVLRGSGYHSPSKSLHSANRNGQFLPDDQFTFIGFRCLVALTSSSP